MNSVTTKFQVEVLHDTRDYAFSGGPTPDPYKRIRLKAIQGASENGSFSQGYFNYGRIELQVYNMDAFEGLKVGDELYVVFSKDSPMVLPDVTPVPMVDDDPIKGSDEDLKRMQDEFDEKVEDKYRRSQGEYPYDNMR